MSGVWIVKKCRQPFFFLSAHRISRKGRYFPRVIHGANAILTELAELRLSSKWTNRKLTSRKRSFLFTIFGNAPFAPETIIKATKRFYSIILTKYPILDKHFLHLCNGHGECLSTRSIVSKADRWTDRFLRIRAKSEEAKMHTIYDKTISHTYGRIFVTTSNR